MANLTTNLATLRAGKQKVIDAVTDKSKTDPGLTIDCTWEAIEAAIEALEIVPDPVIDPDTNVDLTKYCSRTLDESLKVESPTIPEYAFQYQANLPLFKAPNATSIGNYAFRNCTKLTKAELPSVTSVGVDAFRGCTKLEEITGDLIKTVNSSAFYGDTKLDTFNFDEVTSVSDSAFYNCAFTEVSLPKATSIGTGCFAYNSSLLTFTAGVLTTTGASGIVNNCSELTEISMPEVLSLTNSSYFLIQSCPKLTTIQLPKLSTLNGRLVNSCSSITEINLPAVETEGTSYTTIADSCSNLVSINLPNLKNICTYDSYYQVDNCYKLKTLNLPKVAYCYNSETGYSGSYRQFNLISRSGIESLNLPALKNINAYYGCNGLVNNCKELTSVNLNALVKARPGYSSTNSYYMTIVAGCPKLKSITLPSLVTLEGINNFRYGYDYNAQYSNPSYIRGYIEAYKKWYNATYPNYPDDYWKRGNYYGDYRAYYQYLNGYVPNWDCAEPETNVWGSSIDYYNSYCGLQEINLPKLSKFAYNNTGGRYLCYYTEELETLILGDGTFTPETTYLPPYLVYGADKLQSVVLNYPIVMTAPVAISTIFYDCPHLTGTKKTVSYKYASYAADYANPDELQDLFFYVPDDLVDSYKEATNWSTYADQIKPISELAALRFDAGKTIVNVEEFKDDQTLISVSGIGVLEVRASAFENTSATSISLPKAILIGNYTFKDSTSLSQLVLKFDNVTNCGEGAFMNTAIPSMRLNSLATVSKYLFKNTNSLLNISINSATSIGEEAFVGTSLTTFEGPQVARIDQKAFKDLTSLGNITLPNVISIEASAFSNTGLTSINLPLVSYIGKNAFADCDLTSVTIPSINVIDEYAFENNANLANINLYNILKIAEGAFDGCSSLTDITFRGYSVPEIINLSTDITLHVRPILLSEFQAKYPDYTIVGDVQ